MANKKTVVEQYEVIKALLNGENVEGYTLADALAFIDKRIEITQKKNASGKGGEPTEAQKKKMAVADGHKTAIANAMVVGTKYSPTELVKLLGNAEITSTQKITPLLTAMVADGVLTKTTEKGRNLYSLSTDVAEVEDTED